MKTQVIIHSTYKTTQIIIMNEVLRYLSGELSTKVLQRTEFKITFNPWGGYYNLYIHTWSKKDGQLIERMIDEYLKSIS